MIEQGETIALFDDPLTRKFPIGKFVVVEDVTDLDPRSLGAGRRVIAKHRFRALERLEGFPAGSIRRLRVVPLDDDARFYASRFSSEAEFFWTSLSV
jgi:hypothetical protein